MGRGNWKLEIPNCEPCEPRFESNLLMSCNFALKLCTVEIMIPVKNTNCKVHHEDGKISAFSLFICS